MAKEKFTVTHGLDYSYLIEDNNKIKTMYGDDTEHNQ